MEINLYGSGAAGVILMILFTYVISVFVVHTIEQESSIIGALYAMGVTRNQLLVHYLAAPVVVSWLGGVCGLLLSLTPIGCVQQMQDTYLYYSLPQLGVRLPGLLLVYALRWPPPPKRAKWSLPALWPRNSVWARAMCWCCGTK